MKAQASADGWRRLEELSECKSEYVVIWFDGGWPDIGRRPDGWMGWRDPLVKAARGIWRAVFLPDRAAVDSAKAALDALKAARR